MPLTALKLGELACRLPNLYLPSFPYYTVRNKISSSHLSAHSHASTYTGHPFQPISGSKIVFVSHVQSLQGFLLSFIVTAKMQKGNSNQGNAIISEPAVHQRITR